MRYVRAVIFDWAGTTIDHGSFAPVQAVSEVFARQGVALTDAEVRRDMGIYKRDHLRNLLFNPAIAARWREVCGSPPLDADLDRLFAEFIPAQTRVLERYSTTIPGLIETVEQLRDQGVRIASTTGYTRSMLDQILGLAQAQGYNPELSYCPDDTGGGRPLPWMCWRIALELKLPSASSAVKVGDTPSDMEEARRAGMWAVGVTATGNYVGLSGEEWAALDAAEQDRRATAAANRLRAAGAHFVIRTVAELGPVIEEVETRMRNGDTV
jgi:phosphonoacetaldehyde hydrolase